MTDLRNTSAFGGTGWRPRKENLRMELGTIWAQCGVFAEWHPLKTVLLHRPGRELEASSDPNAVLMLAPVDIERAQKQHDALAGTYKKLGVTVLYLEPKQSPPPNQMFMADVLFPTPEGVILARPASAVRAGEERLAAQRLGELGVPVVRTISGSGTFEGADAMWLGHNRAIIGTGLRTNTAGAKQAVSVLREMGVDVITIRMPPDVMHLMGVLRIVDKDLAVVWPDRFPASGVETLKEHGYTVAFLPDINEGLNSHALNFVTVRPREIVMPAGNPVSQDLYERLGITCHSVEVDEIQKAAGSIGCLTGVLYRREE